MQDINKSKGDVVIFGGDHHNGLGLARILGKNGFNVYSVVVNPYKRSWLKYSKYIKKTDVFTSYREGLAFILKKYKTTKKEIVLIPYSDGAALELDNSLDDVKDYFWVPSIGGKAGQIAYYMSKQNQYNFALTHNLKMAKSFTLNFDSGDEKLAEVPFPCILKPILSAEGDKRDIVICNNDTEYEKALSVLKGKNYKRILVQEFINYDYEIDAFGCICHKEPFFNIVPTKTIRSFPPKKGTNSFSEIITDEYIIDKCKLVAKALRDIDFYGLYDIELFVRGDEIWLNEINFRNSGDVYMAIKQGFYYPLVWVNDVINLPNDSTLTHPVHKTYAMTELADIRNVFNGSVSLLNWIRDFRKVDDFAVMFKGDMKPFFYKLLIGFKNRFLGKVDSSAN